MQSIAYYIFNPLKCNIVVSLYLLYVTYRFTCRPASQEMRRKRMVSMQHLVVSWPSASCSRLSRGMLTTIESVEPLWHNCSYCLNGVLETGKWQVDSWWPNQYFDVINKLALSGLQAVCRITTLGLVYLHYVPHCVVLTTVYPWFNHMSKPLKFS